MVIRVKYFVKYAANALPKRTNDDFRSHRPMSPVTIRCGYGQWTWLRLNMTFCCPLSEPQFFARTWLYSGPWTSPTYFWPPGNSKRVGLREVVCSRKISFVPRSKLASDIPCESFWPERVIQYVLIGTNVTSISSMLYLIRAHTISWETNGSGTKRRIVGYLNIQWYSGQMK